MDAWAIIFRNLYTGFLLRDFVGKIVPGTVFLFSICSMFLSPATLWSELKKGIPLFIVVLYAGFAWTVTLGTQSLAESIGIWRYFPSQSTTANPPSAPRAIRDLFVPADDPTFDKATLVVDEFQSKATEDEKQQYERFVVIKEACGNLFVALIFSLPALCVIAWRKKGTAKSRVFRRLPDSRSACCAFYAFLILIGLHRMHDQHVLRQNMFAHDVGEKHKNSADTKPPSIHIDVEPK